MYKLLLCWRYLRTRYIALVCIVSVMLGVATMIVVNSVMAGFSHEMRQRINGMLGDLILESHSMDGVADANWHMQKIKAAAGDDIVGMSPTVQLPALLYFDASHGPITRQVTLVGIDGDTYASVGSFGNYLQHPRNREHLSFTVRDGGYDIVDHQVGPHDTPPMARKQMENAGWTWRRHKAYLKQQNELVTARAERTDPNLNPFAPKDGDTEKEGRDFDMATEQHTGIVLGIGVCGFRSSEGTDYFHALPGDDVRVSFPKASMPPEAISEFYTVVDFYESKMSEYDSNLVFLPLRELQKSRGLIDPETGIGKFNTIQIKIRKGADPEKIRDKLRNVFSAQQYSVSTWQDRQGPLLAAVQMETVVLNILLFMIIAVAGFGILAIFFMIVVEKTRDIGILKSLGASSWGIMGIFLIYGVFLGLVGAGIGTFLGLMIVRYIQELADFVSYVTGQPIFDPSIYYFSRIPTIVEPFTVAWVCMGAVLIAVLASILPAFRAANLHPVRALRYE
jgi:lipoprotein-releasing system permease protein